MWAIWTSRNNIPHDRESLHPGQFLKRIREALMLLELPEEHTRILWGECGGACLGDWATAAGH